MGPIGKRLDLVVLPGNEDDLLVIQVNHLACIGQYGRNIGRQKEGALGDPQNERAFLSGGNEAVGFQFVYDYQRVRAF